MGTTFNLQGHRGARGLRPENTLPSFEAALDAGVTSIETDLRLTRDGAIVLFHDDAGSAPLCRLLPGAPPSSSALVSGLTLEELRHYAADGTPDPRRFPDQDPRPTPAAAAFASQFGLHPFAVPTLDDLFAFVAFYAGASVEHWERARRLVFDLELKRVPGRPELIGDGFDGNGPAALERETVAAVLRAGAVERTVIRSFDHRAVRAVKELEPGVRTAVLIANTAPVDPARLARDAGAELYCPEATFLDRRTLDQLHDAGIAVVPWTVNDADDWRRLLDWGVDGITTDYPDRLAALLRERGVAF